MYVYVNSFIAGFVARAWMSNPFKIVLKLPSKTQAVEDTRNKGLKPSKKRQRKEAVHAEGRSTEGHARAHAAENEEAERDNYTAVSLGTHARPAEERKQPGNVENKEKKSLPKLVIR